MDTSLTNPFANYGSTRVGAALVGRESEVEELVSNLSEQPCNAAIIGMPRIGKSSLLKEVQARIAQAKPEIVTVWIDVGTLRQDAAALFRLTMDSVAEQ